MIKSLKNRSIFVFAFILLLDISLNVNATTYYTFTSGSPSTLTLWWTATNGTGTHPANFTTAGDIFTIQSGNTMTTTGNWTVTGTVLINTGGILSVTSTGTTMNFGALTISSGGTMNENRVLTVTGATNISGTINFASTSGTGRLMTFTGDVTLNAGAVWNELATGNGATDTYNFGGNFTNNATTFNAVGTGVHTFSGAAKTLSGSTITSIGSVAVTGTPTNTGTLTVRTALTGAGTLTNGNGTTGTLNLGGTITITNLTATAANNFVNYTGAAQTAKVTTYNNLTLSGSLAKTFATTPTVNGVLSMEGTATVVVTTGVVTFGASATLQYNTATARTATTEEWITPFVASGGIIIKNTGAITTPGAVQIGNNTSVPLNINSGATLTPGANLITLEGDFINAGTLTSGSGGITIAGTVSTQSIAGFTTTGSVTLTKTSGTATLQGNVNGGPLTINGTGGTLNLGTALTHTFTGIVTLTAGTLNGGSSILNENATSTTAWNGTGTVFNAGTGTVSFGAAAAQTISALATTFNNLTASSAGLLTFTNIPTINGILSMQGTATVSAAPTYGSGATLQYNTATSRTAGVEWITPFAATGGVIIANTGTITMNAAKVFNVSVPLTVNSGSTLSMSTYLLTLGGNLVNNGGTASGTTGGVTISGTATQSIGSFTTTGTVSMSKTGGTATFTGNVNGAALTINGIGGTLNLGSALTHTFTGDITLTAGSLNGGSSTLNENNVSATAWNGIGSVFAPASGTVNFGAAGAQTLAASGLTFNNLILSGSGNKTFSSSATINGNFSISGTAVANLGSNDHSAKSLTLGGTIESSGSWGGTAASPTYVNNTYFLSAATGVVNVNCSAPAAPVSGGNHTICSSQTIPALSVTVAVGVANWYSQADGGTPLASSSLTYTPSAAGTFYAETNNGGCLSPTRTGVSLTINPIPATLALTGSSICTSPGGNGTITSTTSQTGINYQLYNGSNATVQSAQAGTGSGLSWSSLAAGNGYYVIGTNATTACTSTSSTVNITANTNPLALIMTGDTICASPGGNGNIFSSTSQTGINYQLYDGSNNAFQSAQAGTGSGLNWPNINGGNGYYVIGTNATTFCISPSSNAINVVITSNPVALVLTGSTICASPGGNGTITSSTSVSGVSYQLYDNTDTEVETPIEGTGSGLTWSGIAANTGYYVIGLNDITACVSPNSNAVSVSTTANPTLKTVAATASSLCAGTGTNITVAGSLATETYQLRNNADNSNIGSAVAGNGGTLNLPTGNLSATITFNVLATTTATGCATLMVATPTVTVNPVPAIGNFTASAAGVCGGGGSVVTVNSTTLATGNYTVTYNVSGTNTISSTTASMSFTAGSPGTGTFTTANLPTVGAANVVNITSVAVTSTSCSSSVSFNTSVFSTGASGVWTGTTSTNWFTTTNWCNGAIPIASTNVTIPGGLTNYPSIGTTGAVCNNISISSGASLTITGSNGLAVSGNWTNNGTFTANTSTVTFNGTTPTFSGNATTFNNLTLSTSGVNTFTTAPTVNGTLSITGTATVSAAPTFGSAATLQYNTTTSRSAGPEWITPFGATGGVIIASTGSITLNGAKVFNSSVPLTINSGSALNTSSSNYSLSLGGNFSNSGILTANASPIIISGAMTTQTLSGFTTTGLVSMTKTAGTATMQGSINGAGLTINGTGGTLNLGTGLTHTFSGDVTLTAGSLNGGSSTLNDNSTSATAWGGIGSLFAAGTGTVIFGAPGNQTLSASSTTFNNLTFAITGTITFTSATTISGAFTIASGVVANLGTGLSHTAGTLSLGGYGQSAGSWGGATSSATYTNTTYFASVTGIITVGASSCLAGTCVWLGGTNTDWSTASNWCGGIPTNSSTVVIPSGGNQPVISTGGGSAAYCNNLTINSGATLTISGTNTLTITTNVTNNGSFIPGTGSTVVLTGGNQTVSGNAMTFNNLSLISLGVKTFSNAPTVNGFLYMQGTATISIAPIYGSNATLQYQTTTSRTAGVEWITPFTASGGVVIASTGTITLNSVKVFGTSAPLYINPTSSLATNNFEVDFGGSFSNYGTFTAGSSPIVITGAMTTQSIAGFATTGLVSMTKTGGTATFTGSVNGASLIVNGTGGTLNLGTGLTNTFTGNMALTAGTLNAGSSTLYIGGNGSGGGTFTAGTSTVNYNASTTQIVAPFTYDNLTLSGSSSKTFPTGTTTVNGILSMEGSATTTVTGTLGYGSSSTLQYKGSIAQTTGPEFPATWSGSGGIKIENASGVTLGSAGNLGANPLNIGDIVSNSVFSDGGFALTATGTINLTSGTYNVNYSSFPSFTTTTIATGTTVNYSAVATQTVKGITYSNLTISGAGTHSKIADGNITVNGILNLSSANASSTQGCLDMNSTPFVLSMGATATTTGTGDVTGIVNRTTFVVNTPYTFGNQFTTLNIQAGGTLPSSVSAKITLTSSPLSWMTNGIRREYNFIQTGGSDLTLTTMDLHYLSSELYGTSTEGSMDVFDNDTGGSEDHGYSNFNTTNKWVGLANIPISYIALSSTDFTANSWSLGETTLSGVTWVGTTSTDWTVGTNWSGGVAPVSSSNVVIPAVISPKYQPTLPASTTINTLGIQSGGILNGGTSTSLTIAGNTGAWNNKGTFNAGTSTIVFTNSAATMSDPTNFNNVTVANGATLILGTNNVMRIAGTLSLSSTGVLNAASNTNTVEYNGASQTVVNPNGSTAGYSTLILSGSGTKTMPSSALSVAGDFSMNGSASATTANTLTIAGGFSLGGTASATAGAAISVGGNVTLGSGTTFAPSSYSHTISGNWTNNGATFTPGTSTITFNSTSAPQAINGTAASQTFYNLIVAKTSQTLSVSGSTASLTVNNLTETSGNFTAPATLTINGTVTLTSGTLTAGSSTTTINGNVTLAAGSYVPGTTTILLGNWTNNGATFSDTDGTMNFNGSSAQTIGGSATNTFNNITVNNTAGVIASFDQTVNGILNLPAANASSTKGSLDLGAHTLNMGPNGTNTGTGDVTGTVARSSFSTGVTYTFGNQYSSISFSSVGTLSALSVTISIGAAPSWKTGAIQRQYTMAQTGASGTQGTILIHYLDSELNSNTETILVPWIDVSGTIMEIGRTNYDVTNNFITIANVNFSFPSGTAFTLDNTALTSCTWLGGTSTNWRTASNWTSALVPTAGSTVIIPSGTTYQPSIPDTTQISTIQIQSGATLNAVSGAKLTLNGSSGTWTTFGTFNPNNSNVIFTNTNATVSGTTNFYNLTINSGTTLAVQSGAVLGIAGAVTNNGIWRTVNQGPTTINYNGSNQTVVIPNTSTNRYSTLILSGSGTKTMPAQQMSVTGDFILGGTASVTIMQDLAVTGNLTIGSGTSLEASSFNLSVGGNWSNSGTFIPDNSTVVFNGTAPQSVTGSNTFNNLTIYKSVAGDGISASANQTVNGILYLNSPNHSASAGALDLGSYTLNMGTNATTTGTGDVTGTVRRTTLVASTTYTFGNQYSSISFASSGAIPSTISLNISLGAAPSWKTDGILRHYIMTDTGAVGGGAFATLTVHYLNSELNSNTESLLVPWSYVSGYPALEGQRSNFDMTNNFITISEVDFGSFPSGTELTLANTATTSYTWTGNTSTDWNDATNWSSDFVPGSEDNVIIPDASTTRYIPTLPATAEISTIEIQNGGVLNATSGAQLTLDGSSGTWNNQGTFVPNTSTVIFANANATVSGTTNFYNLMINSGTLLAAESDAVIGIAGAVSNGGTWSLVSQGPTTVNYNGGSQSVVIPNASTLRYSTLILSGTGTKTLPASALNINGDFILGGSATAAAGGALTILGQVTLGSGTTFTAGSYTHNLAGNWTNNGGTLSGGTGFLNFNGTAVQTIGGTSSTTFKTLDINNTAGVLLGVTANTTNLTIGNNTSGSLFYDNGYQLTGPGYSSGTINIHSGTFKLGSSTATTFPDTQTRTIADGTTVEYAAATAQSIEAITYSNLTISGAGNNSKTAEGNITVNGILNLSSSNASATQGCLDMSTYTLTMGGSATTTGTGDVTGIVKRTTFALGTTYSFGNQFTTMAMTVGPLPASVSFKIILTGSGGVPWKTDAVNRYYDIISSYASGDQPTESNTRLAMNLHYLQGELNGNMPANLDLFDVYLLQNNRVDDAGRSYSNTTDGWVGFSNVGLYFLSGSAWNQRNWTIGTALYGTNITWLGGSPSGHTDWQLPGNWEGGVPISTSDVTIPGGLPYYPVLPNIAQTINSIQIQSGAVVNSTGTPGLTISGGTGAWQNEGTFNPGSSTVIFTNASATLVGSTNFNSLTVASGASLDPGTGNTIGISGAITLSGSGILNATGSGTTFNYNGSDQTVIIPNGIIPGYYNLSLSGSGSVTMPGTSLSILGDLTISGSASVTPTATVTVSGSTTVSGNSNLILGASNLFSNSGAIILDGGTFKTGAITGYSETVGTLDLTNNSAIVLGTGSHTLTFAASNGVGWSAGQILTISGWTGTYNGSSGISGKIFVGSSNTGLTSMQLAQTRFYDGSLYYSSTILSTGEVVPSGVSNNWTWTGINNNEWDDATNWFSFNGDAPPSGADVIIATGTYQPQVDDAITCHNLTINSGSVLTITSSGALTVANTISNNAGAAGLVIQATSDAAGTTGTLLNNNSAVSATVQRWMSGDLWHLISPAATGGQTVSDFVGTAPNANQIARNTTNFGLAPYTESNDSWNYYLVSGSNTSGTFGVPGKGFQVLRATGAGTGQGNDPADDGNVSFVGTLAAGNQSIGIAQTGNGWNLIGNPYPCALDVIKFLTANSAIINPSYLAIYVSDIGDVSTYGYTAINNSSSFELSSGEGFFVKSASGMQSVSFTTAMKSATSNAFKSAPLLFPAITLSAETGTDKMSTSVKYVSGMTTGLDPGWDAGMFNNGPVPFSLFTRLVQDNGVDFAIQCLPDNNYENLVVPVGLVAAGGSTVTFKAVADNLPSNLKVYLEDRSAGIFTRLDDGSVYSVVLGSATQGAGRFYIHTAESIAITPMAPKPDLKVIPMPQSQLIRVLGAIDLPARALIYDMTGRIVNEMTLTGQDLNDIPLVNASTGLYLLKIESDKALVSEKIRWIKN